MMVDGVEPMDGWHDASGDGEYRSFVACIVLPLYPVFTIENIPATFSRILVPMFSGLSQEIDVFKIAMFSRGFQGFCKGFSGIRCQS